MTCSDLKEVVGEGNRGAGGPGFTVQSLLRGPAPPRAACRGGVAQKQQLHCAVAQRTLRAHGAAREAAGARGRRPSRHRAPPGLPRRSAAAPAPAPRRRSECHVPAAQQPACGAAKSPGRGRGIGCLDSWAALARRAETPPAATAAGPPAWREAHFSHPALPALLHRAWRPDRGLAPTGLHLAPAAGAMQHAVYHSPPSTA